MIHASYRLRAVGYCLLSVAFSLSLCAQTPPCDDITLGSQDEIDNFGILNTLCGGVVGDLTISQGIVGNSIMNLDGLSGLTQVTGNLMIMDNPGLVSVSGLNGLLSVGGNLNLARNADLTTLNGFTALETVGGSLIVDDNDQLGDLDGLISLGGIMNDFIVIDNQNLTDVDGLSGLSGVGGNVQLQINPSLTSVGGLSNLMSVGGFFTIINNDDLLNLDGLEMLETVTANLSIQGNAQLANVDGLSGLTTVSGTLAIRDNLILTDVDGLSNLETVAATLRIEDNPDLVSVTGLSGLMTVNGNIFLQDNASLSACATEFICERATPDPAINLVVNGNTGNCTDVVSLRAECISLPVELIEFTGRLRGKQVELSWVTGREENSDRFVVERSPTDTEWTEVGELPARGNSIDPITYRFHDTRPLSGRGMYRLRQLDSDGSYEYSDVVIVDNLTTKAYPNPFQDVLNLRSDQPGRFELYAADGRVVRYWNHAGDGLLTVRITELPSGNYWLRAANENHLLPIVKN